MIPAREVMNKLMAVLALLMCMCAFAAKGTRNPSGSERNGTINDQLPDCRYSTNRLEVMRSVLTHGPKANQYDYVTNAIHEIEAHLPPE